MVAGKGLEQECDRTSFRICNYRGQRLERGMGMHYLRELVRPLSPAKRFSSGRRAQPRSRLPPCSITSVEIRTLVWSVAVVGKSLEG